MLWTIDIWYCPTIGTVRTNNFRDSLLIEKALAIDFGAVHQLIGIVGRIYVRCFWKTGIVNTNDLGDCPLIAIGLTNDLVGCLLIGIASTIDFECLPGTWIGLVGATALIWETVHSLEIIVRTNSSGSDQPLGMVMVIEFQRALLFESW